MHFEIYKDKRDEWRWRLVSGNNKIIAIPGEGYENRGDCLRMVEVIRGKRDWPVYQDGKQVKRY